MKVGIAGFGSIGKPVAAALDNGIVGLTLTAICVKDKNKAIRSMETLATPVPVVGPLELAETCDIIVECVPKHAFLEIVKPAIEKAKKVITVSGAGILAHPKVVELAKQNNSQIILATGALLGLDAVRAAAEGEILSVQMKTRKPPRSLSGAPYLIENNISISDLKEPLKVFDGTARQGAEGFPANVNVAAALGLAGVGADKTLLQIWADPALERNTHSIEIEADSARLKFSIENVPSEENPGTGKITALSVIATLRSLTTPLKIGT